MNKNSLNMVKQPVANKESCCSQSSCCAPPRQVINTHPKVSRNDPCPCNSGRKFKKCCG